MRLRIIERRHQSAAGDVVLSLGNVFSELVGSIGLPDWSFDLVLVEDEAMANLNSQYRSRTSVTDVLSFSYLLEEGEGACDLSRGSHGAGKDLWVDPVAEPDHEIQMQHIGEIILAPGFITARCQEQKWSVKDEFPMLVVHGALHLLGWDHQLEQEAEAMRDLEEKSLLTCGLIHPLRNQRGIEHE